MVEKIRTGIDEMDYVAAVLSPKSVSSEWVKRELDLAMNQEIKGKRVKVLPLLYKKCNLLGFLEGKFYADFTKPEKYGQALAQVLKVLGVSMPEPDSQIRELKQRQKEIDERLQLLEQQQRSHIKDGLRSLILERGLWHFGGITATLSEDGKQLEAEVGEIYPGNAGSLVSWGGKIEHFGWTPPPNCPPGEWNFCHATWDVSNPEDTLDKICIAIWQANELEGFGQKIWRDERPG